MKVSKERNTHNEKPFTMLSAVSVICMAMVLPSFGDGLPEGYTQLPYLKANKRVQVKTGYSPNATDKIVMTWCSTPRDGNECLWCARSAQKNHSF